LTASGFWLSASPPTPRIFDCSLTICEPRGMNLL
jgi:hypothetical protein